MPFLFYNFASLSDLFADVYFEPDGRTVTIELDIAFALSVAYVIFLARILLPCRYRVVISWEPVRYTNYWEPSLSCIIYPTLTLLGVICVDSVTVLSIVYFLRDFPWSAFKISSCKKLYPRLPSSKANFLVV